MELQTAYIQPAANNRSIMTNSSISRKNFRTTESVQAYRNESMRIIPKSDRAVPGMTAAISKWLSSGDIRLEFYSSKDSGEIRVRIIPARSGEMNMDMSLQTFISDAPLTV